MLFNHASDELSCDPLWECPHDVSDVDLDDGDSDNGRELLAMLLWAVQGVHGQTRDCSLLSKAGLDGGH